jgi:hypothetical protein
LKIVIILDIVVIMETIVGIRGIGNGPYGRICEIVLSMCMGILPLWIIWNI